MATNFPNSPSNGATHTFGGTTYTYNSSKGVWKASADAIAVGDNPPSNPETGALWFDSSVAKTYIYYNDGSSAQWVQLNPSGGSDGADGTVTGGGESPIIYTEPPTSHALTPGSTSTVQMQAVDPEGTAITYGIAYANSTNARPAQLGADTTINQTTGTYTFTPTTTQSDAGSFKARLSATDGVTTSTRFVDVSLAFTHTLHWLVIAGGGGGGGTLPAYANGGGGGAGGYRSSWNNESSGGGGSAESTIVGNPGDVYTITVGAGGNGATSSAVGTDGADSSLARTTGASMTTITSTGGGAGGFASGSAGRNGGSGGGGNWYQQTAGTGTANQGYDGGSGGQYGGGGGGGAGAVGAAASGNTGGNGGVGVASTITGSSVERAGGGGGASGGTASGGGGAGATSPGSGTAGTANTGGGGGAGGITGSQSVAGGAGGSGVVIIRSSTQASSTTGSPVVTTAGSDYVYQFNSNGTITF